MSLPPRQAGLFHLGCWCCFGAAFVHALAHVAGGHELSPHALAGLSLLPPDFVIAVPGSRQPSYRGIVEGLSLSLPVLLATVGGAGLAVARHGRGDAALVRAVAGAFALGTTAVLLLSGIFFFSLVTFVLALPAMCFALAAVREE